jgi:hypothetical protein
MLAKSASVEVDLNLVERIFTAEALRREAQGVAMGVSYPRGPRPCVLVTA